MQSPESVSDQESLIKVHSQRNTIKEVNESNLTPTLSKAHSPNPSRVQSIKLADKPLSMNESIDDFRQESNFENFPDLIKGESERQGTLF